GLPPAVAAPVPIAPTTGPSSVIRLLPPRGKRLSGEVPFEPLLGDISVQKVAYQIDGKTVATKEREPFVARLVLAGRDHPQTVTAIAYDARGLELGRDSLAVNQVTKSFKVKLVEVGNKAPNGDLAVEAQVTLAPGERLDKVELWAGDQLLGRGSAAPLRATVKAAQLASTAFLRAAAALTDGRAVEDVRLLQDGGLVENVEVNLVELYSVVTDRQGHPVKDLAKKDFTVKLDGKKQNLERVAFATEVPLYLGLLVDNSGSMDVLLEDAKQAAAQFLDSVLSPTDRAFLVSFSDRPTLRHRATGNVMELVDSFVGMRAEGSTALYDTILFSLMEFVGSPGRRALVLMTDGSDTQSRLGPNRVIQYARRLGVPVYMIVLGGRRALNGSASMEVTAIAKETGGKVYYPEDVGGLRQAYAEVNDELRSQYLLTFYTEREITPEDRRSVDIDVSRSGLDARLVIKP
ncbi:MAG TPA: VWA domain-containing protein, partial [Thermoanaerobaculia bacterium]|nr:VWA domain-containing protein [Thermoanaerobaculia bacterium]